MRSFNQSVAIGLMVIYCSAAHADIVDDAPEAEAYNLVYELQLPDTAAYNVAGLSYTQDYSNTIDYTFDRVAYHLELQQNGGERVFIYVSLPALALTASQIGVPHSATGVSFQGFVENMHVVSNHPDLVNLSTIDTGSIEFWPSNYIQTNAAGVPNASDQLYDAGDQAAGGSGYGSMQIHDYASGQTLFAYNAWGMGGGPSDLGIGNNPAAPAENAHPDWTFSQNATSYTLKTLRILVRPGNAPEGLSLTIQDPQPHQVVQRQSDDQGILPVGGILRMACERIEGRLIPIATNGQDDGIATEWTVIDDSPSGGSFSGRIQAPSGWYRLELRVWQDERVIDTLGISPVGIGEVFITAGQSNSANHGEFPTTPTDSRISAWGPSGWQFAADPQPIATGEGGTPWPALGDLLASRWNVPVGFISIGWGGTSVDQWRPYSPVGLFSRIELALEEVGPHGVRAILWHQGESDAANGTTAQNYAAQLQEVIAASRTIGGWDMPWGIAKAAFLPGLEASVVNAITEGQQSVIDSDPLNFAGANTEDLLGAPWRYDDVHFNSAGLQEHAERWNAAIHLPGQDETQGSSGAEETNDSGNTDSPENNGADEGCASSETESSGCHATGSSTASLAMLLFLLLPWILKRKIQQS